MNVWQLRRNDHYNGKRFPSEGLRFLTKAMTWEIKEKVSDNPDNGKTRLHEFNLDLTAMTSYLEYNTRIQSSQSVLTTFRQKEHKIEGVHHRKEVLKHLFQHIPSVLRFKKRPDGIPHQHSTHASPSSSWKRNKDIKCEMWWNKRQSTSLLNRPLYRCIRQHEMHCQKLSLLKSRTQERGSTMRQSYSRETFLQKCHQNALLFMCLNAARNAGHGHLVHGWSCLQGCKLPTHCTTGFKSFSPKIKRRSEINQKDEEISRTFLAIADIPVIFSKIIDI